MSLSINEIYNRFKGTKKSLGQKSEGSFKELERFLNFMKAREEKFLTYKVCSSFLEMRKKTLGDYALQQCYETIRHFSKWANLVDGRNECLPKRRRRLKGRRVPIILNDQQVAQIAAKMLSSRSSRPFSAYTYSILVCLLYVTGMRVSEAFIQLRDADVNLESKFIYVNQGKVTRDRYIPITDLTAKMLAAYRKNRDERFPNHRDKFFLIQSGTPGDASSFRRVFARVTGELGFRSLNQKGYETRSLLPHDLRHSFATNTLSRLHSESSDVNEQLSKLSIILGHHSIRETYWYIEIVPDLLAKVMNRRFRNAR